jgi:hypothetical protein
MRSMVPLMLFMRMINSGVVFNFRAILASTSPDFTMYSVFSGDG